MSHFYGQVHGTSKTSASRRGDRKNGLETNCASWSGSVTVRARYDAAKDSNVFEVEHEPWRGAGKRVEVATVVQDAEGNVSVESGREREMKDALRALLVQYANSTNYLHMNPYLRPGVAQALELLGLEDLSALESAKPVDSESAKSEPVLGAPTGE